MLLDLPDHDSTEVAHHVEVDRLVKLADMLVWVLDPQKYADAAIHDRYLRPLASHKDVMLVVLNHIDEVPADRRESMVADLQRLLDADGLAGVPVIATSAKLGDGIPELRGAIAERVADKKAVQQRLMADLTTVAERMAEANGISKPGDVAAAARPSWSTRSPTRRVCRPWSSAVEHSTRRAGRAGHRLAGHRLAGQAASPTRSSGCTSTSGPSGKELTVRRPGISVPEASPVQRARVDTAVRAVADDVGGRAVAAVGDGGPARLGVPAARPQRRPRQGRVEHRPRRVPHARCGGGWSGCCSGC